MGTPPGIADHPAMTRRRVLSLGISYDPNSVNDSASASAAVRK